MRAWLALIVLSIGTSIGKEIALNLPCNNELDGLLAQDPEGNESAFLQCVAVDGVNGIGFWERKFCPNNMVFDFVGQQCKDEEKRHQYRKEANKFNIAILNNSCARGEQCIGGTVCDLETLRCLCPYGTQADLDTLSCITPGMPNQFSTFTGFKPTPSQYGSNNGGGIEIGFLPNPGQPQPQSPQLPFNFNFNLNKNGISPTQMSGHPNGFPDFLMPSPQNGGIDFKPNPFMVPQAPVSKKIPILAPPGKSCKDGELCTGGSLCTRPLGMCLCPGDLEERQGECVLPERAAIIITKVGIGAICGDLAECDHGSTCVNGRCMCVAPLVQEEGRCIMQPQLKEVGPGELCDNGEVCVKGSICDSVIPVCVCPTDTDLRDGECVRMKSNFVRPLPAVAPWATPAPQYQTQPPSSAVPLVPVEPYHPPPPSPAQPVHSLPPMQPISNVQKPAVSPSDQPYRPPVTYTTPSPLQPLPPVTVPTPQQPQQPFVPIQTQPQPLPTHPQFPSFQTQQANIITTPRPMAPYKTAPPNFVAPQSYRAINTPPPQSVKQNIIKLGGSKQAGVGVRCSLNTDCMVGAYCNGNTNPPSCQCLSTHVNVEGKCEKVIYPGQIGCFTDSQCTAAYTGTRCIDRICVCPQGKKAVDQTCVPVNEVVTSPPGGSCSGERECTGGSVCREGWCVCPHHTMIVQKGICVQTQPRPTVPPRTAPPPSSQPATTPRSFPTYPTAPPAVQTRPSVPQTQPPLPAPSPPRQPIVLGRKATPGAQCGPLDTCVGGSMCVEGFCLCPAGSQASELGRCVPATTPPAPVTTPIRQTVPAQSSSTLGGILRVRPNPTQPAQPPPVFASLPPRRPPAASIEVPLTPSNLVSPSLPSTTSASNEKEDDSECRAIGLICKGNTVCRNRSCQCPDGHVLLGDACVLPETEKKASRRGKSWSQANSSKYARPMEDCSHGEQCVGGAECAALSDGTTRCICPIEKPVAKGDWCVAEQPTPPPKKVAFPGGACDENTVCARGSMCQNGFCRCPPGQIAIAGMCTTPPPPAPQPQPTAPPATAPAILQKRANPFDSCEDGELCTGGSSCDEDTGRCMCPIGQIVMINECRAPPTTAKTPVTKSAECQNDTECGAERVCVVGACKCRPGFVDNAGKCEPLEAVEFNERPAPVSYAKHKVQSLAREEEISTEEETTSKPTPRPRVKGLPIRRPKPPKPKSGGSGRGGGGSGLSSRKTSNGEGVCPPGNEPTREEDSGKIIVCNGLEPNCPPRSYCYITSGGFAAEEYNCCKSW